MTDITKTLNLLDFSGVNSFDLAAIAQSMGETVIQKPAAAPVTHVSKEGPRPQVAISDQKAGANASLPIPTSAITQGIDNIVLAEKPDPSTQVSNSLIPTQPLLIRKVFGNPPIRSVSEWDKLAGKARKLWEQRKGIESALACVEFCFFSTAVRWVAAKNNPKADSTPYYHPLKFMAYPANLREHVDTMGGISRYQ